MQRGSFRDEIDRLSIDQLHEAVLQLSSNCFELKKLCTLLLVSAGTLIAAFTDDKLDPSMFVAGVVITIFFWLLDSQSYYYQEKIRACMKTLAEGLAERHDTTVELLGVGMPLSEERENWGPLRRSVHAALNPSMAFYGILAGIMVGLMCLLRRGLIG